MWKPGQIITAIDGKQFRVAKAEDMFYPCMSCKARSFTGICVSWWIRYYDVKMPNDCCLIPLNPKQRG